MGPRARRAKREAAETGAVARVRVRLRRTHEHGEQLKLQQLRPRGVLHRGRRDRVRSTQSHAALFPRPRRRHQMHRDASEHALLRDRAGRVHERAADRVHLGLASEHGRIVTRHSRAAAVSEHAIRDRPRVFAMRHAPRRHHRRRRPQRARVRLEESGRRDGRLGRASARGRAGDGRGHLPWADNHREGRERGLVPARVRRGVEPVWVARGRPG